MHRQRRELPPTLLRSRGRRRHESKPTLLARRKFPYHSAIRLVHHQHIRRPRIGALAGRTSGGSSSPLRLLSESPAWVLQLESPHYRSRLSHSLYFRFFLWTTHLFRHGCGGRLRIFSFSPHPPAWRGERPCPPRGKFGLDQQS